MHRPQEGIGEHGERVEGPPWILGHRGSPREAPENTLVGLRRAIDLGLDGVEYDLHACATGEPVLIHDDSLDRTTDARGPVALLTLPELAGVDAGGWFGKRFAGEPLALLQEALELPGREAGSLPQHMIELKDPALVGEVAREIHEAPGLLAVRVASFQRSVCLEARDLDLPTMLLAHEATEDDRRFVVDHRLTAYGTSPGGWRGPVGDADWPCERWSWSVDDPRDLLAACRRPLAGFNTNEPLRALATRALVFLSPDDGGEYPLWVPPLEVPVLGDDEPGRHGEWSGRWKLEVRVRNPFPFPVRVGLTISVRGGAFDVEGLPVAVRLGPGEDCRVPIVLAGGSWSPCEDPGLLARFVWRRGPGRPEESLLLDAPIERVRTLTLGVDALRVPMLRERPGEPYATMTVRRRGGELLAWVEDAAGREDLRATVRLGARIRVGGRGVRVPLPSHVPSEGLHFSLGFEGRVPGEKGPRTLRRWAGGLPGGLRSGAPGRLLIDASA